MSRPRLSRNRGGWWSGLGLVTWLAAGCASTAGPAVVAPGSEPAPDQPEGLAEGDSADELDARKDKLIESLRALQQAASSDPKQCEDLCSLATSICGVSEKLCNIADDHAGNDHYQDLCREAKRECHEAQADCVACVESLAGGGGTATCSGTVEPTGAAPETTAADAAAAEPKPE